MTRQEALDRMEAEKIRRVKLGVFDLDGALRGKHISLDKFLSSAEVGMGFCDVVFGWDIGDVLYDNVRFTGWHTGYPDATACVDWSTFRLIPWEPGTAFFLLDLFDANAAPLAVAPRSVLRRVVEKAEGYRLYCAAEYEFWFFRETPQSLREKRFQGLAPLTPGMFGYSVLRASASAPLVLDLIDQLAGFAQPAAVHAGRSAGALPGGVVGRPRPLSYSGGITVPNGVWSSGCGLG